MSEAMDVFGEMLEEGVKPSAIAVNHMLAACARDAGDFWKHAKAIFEVRSGGGCSRYEPYSGEPQEHACNFFSSFRSGNISMTGSRRRYLLVVFV